MPLTIDPHGEQLATQLRTGRYHSPEEVVTRARNPCRKGTARNPAEKDARRSDRHIRQSRKGVTLGGLKIKDLIHEGHRY